MDSALVGDTVVAEECIWPCEQRIWSLKVHKNQALKLQMGTVFQVVSQHLLHFWSVEVSQAILSGPAKSGKPQQEAAC